ncbi:MAG: MarR family transcriptional regulator [Planctomycetota bacterium]
MKSPLATEIGKRDAFALPEEETLLNILRTAWRLQEPSERLFRRHGISGPLYNVLRIVRGVGGEGTPIGEIGPRMLSPGPDVPRLVDRVEKLGLAERRRCDQDRRVVRVRLTAKGKRLLAKIDPLLEKQHADLMGHLTASDLASINRLMTKARRSPALCDDET